MATATQPQDGTAPGKQKKKQRTSAASMGESIVKRALDHGYAEVLVKTELYPGSSPDYANAEGHHVVIVADYDVRRVNDVREIGQNKTTPVTFVIAASEKTIDHAGKKAPDGSHLNLLAQDLQRLIPDLGFERVVAVYKDAIWVPQPYAKADRTLLEPRLKWTVAMDHPLAFIVDQSQAATK